MTVMVHSEPDCEIVGEGAKGWPEVTTSEPSMYSMLTRVSLDDSFEAVSVTTLESTDVWRRSHTPTPPTGGPTHSPSPIRSALLKQARSPRQALLPIGLGPVMKHALVPT